jgi:hypothetical protein
MAYIPLCVSRFFPLREYLAVEGMVVDGLLNVVNLSFLPNDKPSLAVILICANCLAQLHGT